MPRPSRPVLLRGSVVASVLLSVLAVGTAGAQAPPYGTSSNDTPAPCPAGTVDCPSQDAFYTAPADLASLPNGALIATRPVTLAEPSPAVKSSLTISYRTEDSFGAPVLGTATLLIPSSAWPGPGPAPLVSWQFPEDSVGGQCRPSYALAHSNTNSNVDVEAQLIYTLLGQGETVVGPDAEGPAETFENGPQAAHSVLDAIRAAESLPAAGLSTTTPVAMTGYSGGSFNTGWATESAASYAPELDIVGAALGGTAPDQAAIGHYLDGTAFSGFLLLTTVAYDRAYPATGVYGNLNARGRAAYAALQGACVNAVFSPSYAYTHLDDYTTTPDTIDQPAFAAMLDHNDLGQHAPGFPVLSYHALNDELVPYAPDQKLVSFYCASATPVEQLTIAGDHISGEVVGFPRVEAFLRARFTGLPAVDTCAATTPLPQVPPIALPEAPASASPSSTPAPGPTSTSLAPAGSTRSSGPSGTATPRHHPEAIRTSSLRVAGRGPVRPNQVRTYTVRLFINPAAGGAPSPLAGRLVGLYVDGRLRVRLRTDARGQAHHSIGFAPGKHLVTAVFYGTPDLRRSTSPGQKVLSAY